MTMPMGLIFSLFDVTPGQEVPFGIPQYMQYIHGLTNVLLCVPFIFADSKKQLIWWLHVMAPFA